VLVNPGPKPYLAVKIKSGESPIATIRETLGVMGG